ncbi:helix-turn-helix domain-containing protein [Mycobacterium intracellulare]|uniref:helix-turn-helix domain-containing protein n=1 Tax=Mycobacterium intracellulare TaxID=1767 RepID=UPI0009BE9AC1|nr:helix-turn-helix transcriptional regulator [Mycobacterium intracellulare]
MSSWFRSNPKSDELLAEERLVIAATEAIHEAMEFRGVSKRELAERLGVQPSEVSQRLSGRRNLTLRSFAKMLHALGVRAKLSVESADQPYTAGVQWKSFTMTGSGPQSMNFWAIEGTPPTALGMTLLRNSRHQLMSPVTEALEGRFRDGVWEVDPKLISTLQSSVVAKSGDGGKGRFVPSNVNDDEARALQR